jgi:hypothetical protein
MRARLAAAVAGLVVIAAGLLAFSLSSRPVVAGTNTVEPGIPSVFLENSQDCELISRVPNGADRLKLLVTNVTGGARRMEVEITDRHGLVSRGQLKPARAGEHLIRLRPTTRAAHPATLCFRNPGQGRITVSGGPKRPPTQPKGPTAGKFNLASAIFVRPGSSSWAAQTGTLADRYANAQTGPLGGRSIWLAALLAALAAAVAIWYVVAPHGRRA